MSFGFVAMQIVIMSLPIVLGWVAHKLDFMDDAFDAQLSRILLNFGLPCMILSSLSSAKRLPSLGETGLILLATSLVIASTLAIAFTLTRLMRARPETESAYRFAIAFSNCGFIGYPIVAAVFGPEALIIASISHIPNNLTLYSVGAMLFSDAKGGGRSALRSPAAQCKSPMLLASLTVLACVLLGVRDLGPAGQALEVMGQITTPAALMLVGSSLAKYPICSMLSDWHAYVAAAGRLLIAPLTGLALIRLLPLDHLTGAIIVLQIAMPVATNGILYCLRYGVDAKPLMRATTLSLIGAVLTIPLVVMLATM